MTDLLVPWLLFPTGVIGVYVVIAGLVKRSWRASIPRVAPLVLGAACFVSAAVIMSTLGAVLPGHGSAPVPALVLALLTSIPFALAAFHGERLLSRLFTRLASSRRGRSDDLALPPSLRAIDAPDRSESIEGVRQIARRPGEFAALTLWTIAAEELLFRGAILLSAVPMGLDPLTGIVLQAAFYALCHVAFGPSALLGKLLFGLLLGVLTIWSGSLAPAVCAHAVYQLLVWRQFRPLA